MICKFYQRKYNNSKKTGSLSKRRKEGSIQYYRQDDRWFLILPKDKKQLLVAGLHKRIRKGHELVNNDKRNTELSTESHNLLMNRVAIGGRTVRFLSHDFGDGSVGDYRAGLLDKVVIQVADKGWLNVWQDNELRNKFIIINYWLTLLKGEQSSNFVFSRRNNGGFCNGRLGLEERR